IRKRDVEADRERNKEAYHQRSDHGADHGAKSPYHYDYENEGTEIYGHVGSRRKESTRYATGKTRERCAPSEHAEEHHGKIVSERFDSSRPVGSGPHDDANACVRKQQVERRKHRKRHTTHEQSVEWIIGLENGEGRKIHIARHSVHNRRVTVKQLDRLFDNEGDAKRQ